MQKPKMIFAAAGDFLASRLVPMDTPGFAQIAEYVRKADASFFNLETTLHRGGIPGNQFAGGSNHRSDPKVLRIAEGFGFNMTSFANNHTFDYGYEGLEATLQVLDESSLVHTGVGRNLDEASAPCLFRHQDRPCGADCLHRLLLQHCLHGRPPVPPCPRPSRTEPFAYC